MSNYLYLAAEQLKGADAWPPDSPRYRQHMDLAARYERLAMIEQGLLPADTEETDR